MRGGRKIHTLLCLLGLFTISWDRFGNVPVGTYNVKLSVIAFAGALAASLLDVRRVAWSPQVRAVQWAISGFAAAYVLGVVFAVSVETAAVQAVTVVLGALVPYWATSRCVRLNRDVAPLLSALILGGLASALFGFYQLASFYTGLPNPVPYYGLGGGVGRIASFSYEPAYFAYFLILTIGAWFAREAITGVRHSRVVLVVLFAGVILSNSRAMVLMLPLLLVLLFLRARNLPGRKGLAVGLFVGVYALVTAMVASPSLQAFLTERVTSIVNLHEPSSNAPRIEVYGNLLQLVADQWETGVGPGNLFLVGPQYGMLLRPDAAPNNVVANNIWLQALSDGGVILGVAQLVLVLVVARQLFRRGLPATRTLAAGWLSVIVVGGMLTSYFYDLKLWAVLGLAVGATTLIRSDDSSGDRQLQKRASDVGRADRRAKVHVAAAPPLRGSGQCP